MSDNDSTDFDDDNFDDGLDFEDFDTGDPEGGSLTDNPLFKIGAIVGGIVLVIAIIIAFSGEDEATQRSVMNTKSGLDDIPGQGPVDQQYKDRVDDQNRANVEEAIRSGTSALPTLVEGPDKGLSLPSSDDVEEDPLERWRRIQEERRRQQQDFEPPPEFEGPDPKIAAIEALANAMSEQMTAILEAQLPGESSSMGVTEVDFLATIFGDDRTYMASMPLEKEYRYYEPNNPNLDRERVNEVNNRLLDQAVQDGDLSDLQLIDEDGDLTNPFVASTSATGEIVIPAGEIEYAQIITEANSDVPGPVLAQIVTGPLAGSKMIGEFEVSEDYLVLTFDSLVFEGVTYETTAVALNPKTANVGVATEVDRRYLRRIILPAAAEFVTGFAEAASESASSSTTIDGGNGTSTTSSEDLSIEEELFAGFEEAAGVVSEVLEEEADIPPLVKVHAGTPLGILFLAPVVREDS
jgi:intracellular multiplication protein IcmE